MQEDTEEHEKRTRSRIDQLYIFDSICETYGAQRVDEHDGRHGLPPCTILNLAIASIILLAVPVHEEAYTIGESFFDVLIGNLGLGFAHYVRANYIFVLFLVDSHEVLVRVKLLHLMVRLHSERTRWL